MWERAEMVRGYGGAKPIVELKLIPRVAAFAPCG
jgi:hypothetical protein